MYLIVSNTVKIGEVAQKCMLVDTIAIDEPGLKEFLYECCYDFITNLASGNWTSEVDKQIDSLDEKEQAKWLLGDCFAKGDFGDILFIFTIKEDVKQEGE